MDNIGRARLDADGHPARGRDDPVGPRHARAHHDRRAHDEVVDARPGTGLDHLALGFDLEPRVVVLARGQDQRLVLAIAGRIGRIGARINDLRAHEHIEPALACQRPREDLGVHRAIDAQERASLRLGVQRAVDDAVGLREGCSQSGLVGGAHIAAVPLRGGPHDAGDVMVGAQGRHQAAPDTAGRTGQCDLQHGLYN